MVFEKSKLGGKRMISFSMYINEKLVNFEVVFDKEITECKQVLLDAAKIMAMNWKGDSSFVNVFNEYRFVFTFKYELNIFVVYICKIKRPHLRGSACEVVDYSPRYTEDIVALIKQEYRLEDWFHDSIREMSVDYMAHKILHHIIDNGVLKVAVDAYDEVVGYIGINLDTESGTFLKDIDELMQYTDSSDLLAYVKDYELMSSVANSYSQDYDCTCESFCVRSDKRGIGIGKLLMDSVVAEIHGRGYQSLALWTDNKDYIKFYAYYGFDVDSKFYSRVLSDDKVDNTNNAVRFVLEI